MTNEIGLMVISGIQDCPTSITPGREEEGMGYYGGGVTMGKCFYCMLLAPPPRLPSSPTTEERYLSPPFPGIPLRNAQRRISIPESRADDKQESRNLADKL